MAGVVDVARFILSARRRKNLRTTPDMLQGLLYICQGWMLVARDCPLFPEVILADKRGPIVREIETQMNSLRRECLVSEEDGNEAAGLTTVERMLVERVLRIYEDCSGEKPSLGESWPSTETVQIISHDSILYYFSQLDADAGVEKSMPRPYLADISVRSFLSENDYEQLEEYMRSA
ncbi:Panacea domain-containing protein [Alloscardovia macacae]|uniref:Panacea domain-containing protein n=1 Tax=Alloscardovia macacae TaxID=1160091 RepID=UPI0015D71257|nr:hypothetical protein [Alloscardovia macacae]